MFGLPLPGVMGLGAVPTCGCYEYAAVNTCLWCLCGCMCSSLLGTKEWNCWNMCSIFNCLKDCHIALRSSCTVL